MRTTTRPHLTAEAQKLRRNRIALIAFLAVVFTTGLTLLPDALMVSAARQNVARQNVAKGAATAAKAKTGSPAAKTAPGPAQSKSPGQQVLPDGSIVGTPVALAMGAAETVADIMLRESVSAPQKLEPAETDLERQYPSRRGLPQNPLAQDIAQWPPLDKNAPSFEPRPTSPQTTGTSFTGATLSGTNPTLAFPPDSMGAVGPTQFIVMVNNRIVSFNKSTGVADAVINSTTNTFFNTVRNSSGTSDPRIRYDRLSGRWFFLIINVSTPNRILLGVTDAASNGTITGSTVMTFFFIPIDTTTPAISSSCLMDYPLLGIDEDALYIGGNNFCPSFDSTDGYVVRKTSVLGAGPLVVTAFRNLTGTPAGAGPFTPQGVDNYATGTNEGYFIGVDNATFGTLMLRRVSNPDTTPTISANISIATPAATTFPLTVPHLGQTGGTNGRLDALDDRLFAAHIRNGRLWTAHNLGVNNTGASSGTIDRDGVRWYELQGIISPGTPSFVQSGTVFTATAGADSTVRNYWIPSIMVSGQGHAALGFSTAGTNERINAGTVGRLAGDTLGAMQTPVLYTASSTAYNPPSDPGGASGRRWGDYSYASLDPSDDMTMWTIQEFCDAANSYGVRIVKLIAPPPPAAVTPSPASVPMGVASTSIALTGTSVSGTGFYDPGSGPPAGPAFNHLAASATGAGNVTVNSITYLTPTTATLNISTVGATSGAKSVTITNPDGQTTSVSITVGPTAVKVSSFDAATFDDGRVLLQWRSGQELDNLGYNVYREAAGKRVKITPQLVAGSALTAGSSINLQSGKSYAWADQPQTSAASYWLEDIDLSGKSAWTGPITVKTAAGRSPSIAQSTLISRIGMAQAQLTLGQGSTSVESNAAPAAAAPAAVKVQSGIAGLASSAAFKLGVKREGWYRITQRDLLAAGLDSRIDPRLLQMYVDGQQIPIVVTGEQNGRFDVNDTVEFYGLGLNSTASDTRVYWLVVGSQGALRIKPAAAPGGTPGPASFPAAVERKDRTLYFSSLRNGETENFFGPVIASAPVDQTLTLSNLAAAGASANLDVFVQGVTKTAHQVKVTLNETEVGTISFSGQSRGKGSFVVPQSSLRSGDNSVQLVSIASSSDISLVDSLRITYWHSFNADGNQLRFGANGGQSLTIGGFTASDIRVMDITNPSAVQQVASVITGSKTGASVTLTAPGSGPRVLLAFTGSQAKTAAVKANTPSSWRQEGLVADLVIITRSDLMPSVAPLRALRQSQGLSVAVIDVEDLYDEFSFGDKSPQAIKDFLSFASSSWRPSPRFVLLAGDASYDPKNYLGFGDSDLVPSKVIDTYYMEAASDDWFADFNGDGVPEMAVGRLPVRTAGEAGAMVSKIIGYDQSVPSASVLMASDSNDGFDFGALSRELRPLLPGGLGVEEVRRGSSDDATVKSQLIAGLNRGQKMVNYFGHGSVDLWRGNMMTTSDALALSNGKSLSMFVLMTCLNGYFNDPALDSLGESLMKSNGGAVSVWASSAMCDPVAQSALDAELYRQLFSGGSLTIGEAASRVKAAATDLDVRRTWILFGDPSGKLR